MLTDRGRRPGQSFIAVIALDRWGRVLLMRGRDDDTWSLPGGAIEPGESADAAALRAFEEDAGHLLEELRLFGIFQADNEPALPEAGELHVYYSDPDLDVELVGEDGGDEFRYFVADELAAIPIRKAIRAMIEGFVQSTHYRAMFH